MAELDGVFIPVTTPYRGDDVATDRLADNLRAWNATALAGYVLLGSTGEFPMLSGGAAVVGAERRPSYHERREASGEVGLGPGGRR